MQKRNQTLYQAWYHAVGEHAKSTFPREVLEEVKATAFHCLSSHINTPTGITSGSGDDVMATDGSGDDGANIMQE